MHNPYIVALILFGGAALTFARRWNNGRNDAGSGVAAWTIVILLMYLF
jgi:hypothetical protein